MATSVSGEFRSRSFTSKREAEDYLSNLTKTIKSVRFSDDGGMFRMRYDGASLGSCDIHHGVHSALSFEVERSDEFLLCLPTKGPIIFDNGRSMLTAVANKSALLLPPHLTGHTKAPADTQGLALVVPANALRQHVRDAADDDQRNAEDVSEGRVLSLDDPVVGSLARNLSNVFREMRSLSVVGLSKLASANFDDLLLGLAGTAIVRRGDVKAGRQTQVTAPTKLEAARDYLEAHAAEAVRLADLARSLGLSMRVLQAGFARHFGCSPRTYLQRCRLRLARERLLDARSGTTVSSIAYEAGFSDLTAFAKLYKEAFGELPSATMKRR